MASWKKILVSGSAAKVATLVVDNLTSGQVVIGGGTGNLSSTAVNGSGNILATTGATGVSMTGLFTGSFSGSFRGDGTNLTGVTATPSFPTVATTNLASTDKFFVNDDAGDLTSGNKKITYANLLTDLAGTNLAVEGTDSLTLATTITGLTAVTSTTFTGQLVGSASSADQLQIANYGGGTLQLIGIDSGGTYGAKNAVAGSTLTYNTTTNTLNANAVSASNAAIARSASFAQITDTTTGTGPYYLTFVDASTGYPSQRVDSTGLTYNATTNTITATSSFASQALSASWAPTPTLNPGTISASAAGTSQGQIKLNGVDLAITGLSTADSPTFNDLTVSGNLAVLGSVVQFEVTNLNVEDRFILLNSGSATGDGGIIVQSGSGFSGPALGFQGTGGVNRWGVQQTTLLSNSGSTLAVEAYVGNIVDVAAGHSDTVTYQKNGNIKIESGEIYIWA